jgi:hypothetical protein
MQRVDEKVDSLSADDGCILQNAKGKSDGCSVSAQRRKMVYSFSKRSASSSTRNECRQGGI